MRNTYIHTPLAFVGSLLKSLTLSFRMGISFSCPFGESIDLENGFQSIIVKSISSFANTNEPPNTYTTRSVSFNNKSSMMLLMPMQEEMISISTPEPDKPNSLLIRSSSSTTNNNIPTAKPNHMMDDTQTASNNTTKHDEAALKLQKVYKSFRTRRKLADCAVLVEQGWWKLLDFAELKRSSVSFFELEKHETAVSRWSRAKNRAAKVGKGLSKNGKAQKLALQHWLEAIDPRHRYGHNLHFYYVKWLHCQSREPFFYWLDIGEGKEVNIVEKCPRSKLQQQCIKYLGPMERKTYEVVVENGKLVFMQTRELLDTSEGPKDAKWIFVLSTSKNLYVGKKKKGTFQHSSFLAGGATLAAGRLVVESGVLKAVWPHSGHYQPTEENFKDFISFLKENNVDLKEVKMSPVEEEEGLLKKQRSSMVLTSNSSEEDLTQNVSGSETNVENLTQENTNSMEEEKAIPTLDRLKSRRFHSLRRELRDLEIPDKSELLERLEIECQALESPLDGYETAEEALASDQEETTPKQNLSEEENEKFEIQTIGKESILQRINSQKGLNSYQLGKQLSCKWTSGAGPRIGCVGDYPSELRIRALEEVNLSPRSASRSGSYFSPRSASGLSLRTSLGGETEGVASSSPSFKKRSLSQRSIRRSSSQCSPFRRGALDFYSR